MIFLGKIKLDLIFRVSGLEINCHEILSCVLHNNHNYHLYTYGKIENIPEGVIVKDGTDILAEKEFSDIKWGLYLPFQFI